MELMAYPKSGFSILPEQEVRTGRTTTDNGSKDVADSESERVQRLWSSGEQKPHTYGGQKLSLCGSERPRPAYWEAEPGMGRVVDGIPNRVDRIKGLGNAVVPMVVEVIGNAIMEI